METSTVMTLDNNKIRFTAPIEKIDRENRKVSGWATIDSADTANDVITAEASRTAFKNFRGNLREMHIKDSAVGRVLDFREEDFNDPKTGKNHRGVWVTTYISKGAPNTWEKVLDGTLNGFSIGGELEDSRNEFDKAVGANVRYVTKYSLNELSLVDNPGHQHANILSIEKVKGGGTVLTGLATETQLENVFYCTADDKATLSNKEAFNCPKCQQPMKNRGWIESNGKNLTEKVRAVITKGGVNMPEENLTEADKLTPTTPEELQPEEEGVTVSNAKGVGDTGSPVEEGGTPALEERDGVVVNDAPPKDTKAADKDAKAADKAAAKEAKEADKDSEKLEKVFSTFRESLEKSFKDSTESTQNALDEVKTTLEKSFDAKANELAEKQNEILQKFADMSATLSDVETRLGGVEGDTAVRKSGGLGGSTEITKSKTSKWGGSHFSVDSLIS